MPPPSHHHYGYPQPPTLVYVQPQGLVIDTGTIVIGALALAFLVLALSPKGRKR